MFDPKKRISAAQALENPYLAQYHEPSDEPVADEKFDWSFNDADLPVETWKLMMLTEILDYHRSTNSAGNSGDVNAQVAYGDVQVQLNQLQIQQQQLQQQE